MYSHAIPLVLRRPRTLMVLAAGLATAATLFTGAFSASADDSTAPGAPQAVEAKAGDGAAKVRWHAPESDGGSPILYYTVSSEPAGVSATTGPASLAIRVDGLTNGTEYTFTVSATNEIGMSDLSDPSNPVTPNAAPSLDELIAKLQAHFERAIGHVEAHAAMASKHAHERARLSLAQTQIRLDQALSHTNEHVELRAQHLKALAEAAQGTPRADEVQARVEKAMAEMRERADEKRQKVTERHQEQREKIQSRLDEQLEKIGGRADEQKAKLAERREAQLEKLKERFNKSEEKRNQGDK